MQLRFLTQLANALNSFVDAQALVDLAVEKHAFNALERYLRERKRKLQRDAEKVIVPERQVHPREMVHQTDFLCSWYAPNAAPDTATDS